MLSGRANVNLLLDIGMYDIEFTDSGREEFATNIIMGSTYSSIDDEEKSHTILSGISDYRKLDDDLNKADCMVDINGRTERIITTKC